MKNLLHLPLRCSINHNIQHLCFCVVQMEELFAIAVSFGKIVRTRGFSRVLKNPKLFNASHATFSHAFCLVFVFTRDARKERTHKRAKCTTRRRLMSRQVGFNLESISLSSSSSSEEEEDDDGCDFEARKKEDTETRKVLRYDAEDVTTTTKNNHHHPFASSNKKSENGGILLETHERNVREVLRKAICVDEEGEYSSDFEEEEEKRTEEATKEDREEEEEKEDFNAAPASTTTSCNTTGKRLTGTTMARLMLRNSFTLQTSWASRW